MISDIRYTLFNLFIIFIKYSIFIPCKYCIYRPCKYCIDDKHNKYHILLEKYKDLNENYDQLEIKLNCLIDIVRENNNNLNNEFSELLKSINYTMNILDTKLDIVDNKLNIIETKYESFINKTTKRNKKLDIHTNNNNNCYYWNGKNKLIKND